MTVLGIESSAASASAAVVKDGKLLSEMYLNVGLTHSVTLLPLVNKALEFSSVEVSSLDAIAVSRGPGSFTGIRIGIAAAKGLAQPFDIPCVPVSTLEAIAYPLIDSECTAVSVMDARCSQVYCAVFSCVNGRLVRRFDDCALSFEELAEKLSHISGKKIFIGDGADITFKNIGEKVENSALASPIIRFQRASSVALSGEIFLNENNIPVSCDKLIPFYLRLPQAQQKLKKS